MEEKFLILSMGSIIAILSIILFIFIILPLIIFILGFIFIWLNELILRIIYLFKKTDRWKY
jgi:uncharacterized protein YybS (DUF2232 family)